MTSTRTTSRVRERSGCSRLAPEEAEELSLRLVGGEPDHATLVGLDARLREDVLPPPGGRGPPERVRNHRPRVVAGRRRGPKPPGRLG